MTNPNQSFITFPTYHPVDVADGIINQTQITEEIENALVLFQDSMQEEIKTAIPSLIDHYKVYKGAVEQYKEKRALLDRQVKNLQGSETHFKTLIHDALSRITDSKGKHKFSRPGYSAWIQNNPPSFQLTDDAIEFAEYLEENLKLLALSFLRKALSNADAIELTESIEIGAKKFGFVDLMETFIDSIAIPAKKFGFVDLMEMISIEVKVTWNKKDLAELYESESVSDYPEVQKMFTEVIGQVTQGTSVRIR